ncbi:hypothetical protein V6N13_020781 [Hibiscus sabdariffa]|uniref:Uncharacterized protein n=1 Tax=Hibiscus sabdariffa TaxID=183260 RepID=A0ABR2EUJ9_9ROSI
MPETRPNRTSPTALVPYKKLVDQAPNNIMERTYIMWINLSNRNQQSSIALGHFKLYDSTFRGPGQWPGSGRAIEIGVPKDIKTNGNHKAKH